MEVEIWVELDLFRTLAAISEFESRVVVLAEVVAAQHLETTDGRRYVACARPLRQPSSLRRRTRSSDTLEIGRNALLNGDMWF